MSTSDFYNIDYNSHYFIPLEVAEATYNLYGFEFAVYNPNHTALVECIISEAMYGKVQAVPVDYEAGLRMYRPENYYASDFASLVKEGIIIKKETETQHVELVDEWEPLTANTHLVHRGYVVAE